MKITWYVDLSDTIHPSEHRFLIWTVKHRTLFEWFSSQFCQGCYITCILRRENDLLYGINTAEHESLILPGNTGWEMCWSNLYIYWSQLFLLCTHAHAHTYVSKNILFLWALNNKNGCITSRILSEGKIHLYSCATKSLFFFYLKNITGRSAYLL